ARVTTVARGRSGASATPTLRRRASGGRTTNGGPENAARARTGAAGPDGRAPYAPSVSDADRERDLRRLERDRRRREAGRPTAFDEVGTSFRTIAGDSEDPTLAIRHESLEEGEFVVAEEAIG